MVKHAIIRNFDLRMIFGTEIDTEETCEKLVRHFTKIFTIDSTSGSLAVEVENVREANFVDTKITR